MLIVRQLETSCMEYRPIRGRQHTQRKTETPRNNPPSQQPPASLQAHMTLATQPASQPMTTQLAITAFNQPSLLVLICQSTGRGRQKHTHTGRLQPHSQHAALI